MPVPLISALPTVPSYDNTNFESLAPAFLSFLKNTFQAEMNAAIAAINNYDYGSAVNASIITGQVAVANGGTGLSTLAAGRIPYGAGTGDFGNSENLFWDSVNNRMGINTNSPLQSFHNVGESTVLERTGSASGHLVRFYRSGTQKWILQAGATVDQDDMRLLNSATENVFSILQNKNIGINTTAPSTKLHVNGPARVGSYTVATVPNASTAGAGSMIYVTDDVGGAVIAFSDGTNWLRVTDRAIVSTT